MGAPTPAAPVACGDGLLAAVGPVQRHELDPKWEVVNPGPAPPTVGDGHLKLPIVQGDLYGDHGNAQMLLQQCARRARGSRRRRSRTPTINADGEAAGLALINSSTRTTSSRPRSSTRPTPTRTRRGDQPGKWAERVLTSNSSAVTLPPATVPWPNSGALDTSRATTSGCASSMTPPPRGHDLDLDERDDVRLVRRADQRHAVPLPAGRPQGRPVRQARRLGRRHRPFDAFNVVVGTADPQTRGRRLRRHRCSARRPTSSTAPRSTRSGSS